MGRGRIALNQINSEKDIGIIVDSSLTFRENMTEKVNKANRVMGVIRRTYTYLNESTFLSSYKALVRPLLEYANQVWAPHSVKYIEIIENVQRRATKCIPGLVGMEYPERVRSLKLPTLAYRRLRGDMIETFKILQGKYDPQLSSLLEAQDKSDIQFFNFCAAHSPVRLDIETKFLISNY